jgi:hypothetical protein
MLQSQALTWRSLAHRPGIKTTNATWLNESMCQHSMYR